MAILVTGGAGYIGSGTVELLQAAGENVVVLDNLSRGHRAAVQCGRRRSTVWLFPSGSTSASTAAMPSRRAIASALVRWSPVNMT